MPGGRWQIHSNFEESGGTKDLLDGQTMEAHGIITLGRVARMSLTTF